MRTLWQNWHYFIIYAKIWANTLEGFHLVFPMKYGNMQYEHASIFSIKSVFSLLFSAYNTLLWNYLYCLVFLTQTTLVSSWYLFSCMSEVLPDVLWVALAYRRLAVKSWIRAWTGLWAKLLIQAVWAHECRVRFRRHDSGDMPKSSCSGDL